MYIIIVIDINSRLKIRILYTDTNNYCVIKISLYKYMYDTTLYLVQRVSSGNKVHWYQTRISKMYRIAREVFFKVYERILEEDSNNKA